MEISYNALASITVVDGKPVVELEDNRYKVVTTIDGTVCIIERKPQKYYPIR